MQRDQSLKASSVKNVCWDSRNFMNTFSLPFECTTVSCIVFLANGHFSLSNLLIGLPSCFDIKTWIPKFQHKSSPSIHIYNKIDMRFQSIARLSKKLKLKKKFWKRFSLNLFHPKKKKKNYFETYSGIQFSSNFRWIWPNLILFIQPL